MRKLDVNVLFPYNWYHARRVKIYDDRGTLLTKIRHYEYKQLEIDYDVKSLVIKIDFYKYVVAVPQDKEQVNLAVYLNCKGGLFQLYSDSLKKDFVRGRFMDDEEFRNFDLSFYNLHQQVVMNSQIDVPAIKLGFLLAAALIVMSVVEQDNPYQHLVFFIGIVSFISLLMVWFEKGKLLLFDYKSRMAASGLAFILGAFFIQSAFPVAAAIMLFSILFLLRVYHSLTAIAAGNTD